MADALGSDAQLLGKFNAGGDDYGDLPTGDWEKLPFVSSNLGSEQPLVENDVIGLGRDPATPTRDVITVSGDVVVPMDLRDIGFWLKALFGAPVTSGASAPYTHTFSSGGTSLPQFALEIGHPQVPVYLQERGLRANSMALNFQPSGTAQATVNLIGQQETKATGSGGGTPTTRTYKRFSPFQGSISKDGSALGRVTAATATYSNNLDPQRTIRSDGFINEVLPGIAAFTGDITVRFADTALLDDAIDGTAVSLALAYTIDADNSLTFTAGEVYLPKPRLTVDGPGGVEATFSWQASKPSGSAMLTAVLVNDIASYA